MKLQSRWFTGATFELKLRRKLIISSREVKACHKAFLTGVIAETFLMFSSVESH